MQHWAFNLKSLLKKLGGLLLLYLLCRILFFAFNRSAFSDAGAWELIKICFFALRFDLSVIVLSNCLFIILYLLPFRFRETTPYRLLLKWLFILVNSLAMIANCVDMAYFQFTLKRSTADIFNFFGGHIGNDATRLLPLFLIDYWYLVLLAAFLCYLVARTYKRSEKELRLTWNPRERLRQTGVFASMILLSVFVYRGGFQLKPITIVDAAEYVSARHVALVISTPFSILKTMDLEAIEPLIYYTDENELRKLYTPVHLGKTKGFKKLNVFVIALESFSKEYVSSLNNRPEGYTPFLDSLIGAGYACSNAFANGKTSITGIPSIVAGIPSWMNEPFITSAYSGNQVSSIASLLKAQGYYTAFFHGGTNGTMGFDAFASLAGYDHYFGRTEYNNEKDYDGNWGIWDEEFMQYTANTISDQPEPFCATLFTLTSHHPYPVPDKYKGKFREGPLPIERSIGYSDFSLRRFFETARTKPWFNNTLFVLVADHTGTSADPYYVNSVGNNAIPLLYFMPTDSTLKGRNPEITSQIDILPSVMDYLNYPSNYFAFGKSIFDPAADHFSLSLYNTFDYQEGDHYLDFDGKKVNGFYNYKTDSLLGNNLQFNKPPEMEPMLRKLKAILQTYQQSMINNKMH
jgi:hypothetical protein